MRATPITKAKMMKILQYIDTAESISAPSVVRLSPIVEVELLLVLVLVLVLGLVLLLFPKSRTPPGTEDPGHSQSTPALSNTFSLQNVSIQQHHVFTSTVYRRDAL